MMTHLLRRALPFIITLIVGTGLGNIFGIQNPATSTHATRRARCAKQPRFEINGVGRGDRQVTGVKIMYQPKTQFTPEALRNQTTGVVTLLVRFNADGTTTVVERLSTLPDGLTEDAKRLAEHTSFTPATVDGKPVQETKEMNYIYSLRDNQINEPYELSEP